MRKSTKKVAIRREHFKFLGSDISDTGNNSKKKKSDPRLAIKHNYTQQTLKPPKVQLTMCFTKVLCIYDSTILHFHSADGGRFGVNE